MIYDLVVDRVWKSGGKQTVSSRSNRVNSSEKLERINICRYGIHKIIPKPGVLGFIKENPCDKILLRFVKNPDFHRVRSRMRCFASAQSLYTEVPSLTLSSRAFMTSVCQAGTGMSIWAHLRLSHISSNVLNLSATVILSSGNAISIGHPSIPVHIIGRDCFTFNSEVPPTFRKSPHMFYNAIPFMCFWGAGRAGKGRWRVWCGGG